jgi:separase
LANSSAHDARDRINKESKKDWWANREALDTRLKRLLRNIETFWFGGFRGIFSHKVQNRALLTRFVGSFQKILDKHLPSRRKGAKCRSPKVDFHQSVMELFTSIGNIDESSDPEDAITDLLYFVIDILQFQGERNAYDEIDFDMMAIDTLDALRSYKEAERNEQMSDRSRHTILILDKALHSFPWESLECMQGSSVSRMPSLHCLQKRILQLQSEYDTIARLEGFHIDSKSGSYILNPSGDLKSTQNTFEVPLSTLDNWTRIIQREPTEEEFKQALATKEILLYFGHGSGAQYIRGRTIKRLDRCAVAFLMGCSSGSMTEAGEFESYGTPINYMHAGAPALVATLWDVTDKDIDRFAKAAFEQWGLLKTTDEHSRNIEIVESSNIRGYKATKSDQQKPTELSSEAAVGLDTAVSNSRGACILRYLNGAAPVVYGVPVFLR